MPTMWWIMEWDVVGDWRAGVQTVHRASRGEVQATIDEGFESGGGGAGHAGRHWKRAARGWEGGSPSSRSAAFAGVPGESCALDWWRTPASPGTAGGGGAGAEGAVESREEMRSRRGPHLARFGGDLDFPAYDFAPALKALERHDRNPLARDTARVLLLGGLLGALVLLAVRVRRVGVGGLGEAARPSEILPSRLPRTPAAFALIPASGMTLWMLMSFQGEQAVLAFVAMVVALPMVLALTWSWWEARVGVARGRRSGPAPPIDRDAWTRALLWPLLVAVLPPLALMAIRGPELVWFLFWSDTMVRALLLALLPATVLAMGAVALQWGAARRHLPVHVLWGRLLLGGGVVLVLLGLALPDLPSLLATLDDPLSFLPMRLALIVAVTAYAGVPNWITLVPGAAGVGALLLGAVLLWWGRPPIGGSRDDGLRNDRTRRRWFRRAPPSRPGSPAIRPEPLRHPGPSGADGRWPR